MTGAELLADHGGARVYHAAWEQLAEVVRAEGGCDALIVDAPYSERTHAGHDSGVDEAGIDVYRGRPSKRTASRGRRSLSYDAWDAERVASFVAAWAPLTRGWFVSLTDWQLAPAWCDALEDAGRYVFSPLACVDSGSRVRLLGDGPSQWSVYAVVARPRCEPYSKWGTLPGAYVVPDGAREDPRERSRIRVVGGKPLWLMRALVRDYTRPGDLVVDPCCGAGTTLLAARLEGRRAIGGDVLRAHAELAAERVRGEPTRADRTGTLALFGDVADEP